MYQGVSDCTSVVAVLRPDRSDGKEALVVYTQLHANNTLSASVALALVRHFATVQWLSRSLILVAPDGSCEAEPAAASWLADYAEVGGRPGVTMLRGGSLSAGVVFDTLHSSCTSLQLRVHGPRGVLPNLDVPSLVLFQAGKHRLRLAGVPQLVVEAGHATTAAQYVSSALSIIRFWTQQASGCSNGCEA